MFDAERMSCHFCQNCPTEAGAALSWHRRGQCAGVACAMSSSLEKLSEKKLLANNDANDGTELTIQSVTAACNLDCAVDLEQVARRYRDSEFNPTATVRVVTMRLRKPKTTAFLERSGKMVVMGAKSEADARTAAIKFARIVQHLGFKPHLRSLTIQHILGSCDVQFPINLEAFAKERAEQDTEEVGAFTASQPGPACMPAARVCTACGDRPPRRSLCAAARYSCGPCACGTSLLPASWLLALRRHVKNSEYALSRPRGARVIYRMVRRALPINSWPLSPAEARPQRMMPPNHHAGASRHQPADLCIGQGAQGSGIQ